MYKITKQFTFDAAHRLLDYEGPCANLHGHTYLVIVELSSSYLDDRGFVIDYADIKEKCKGWVDKHWDHGAILNEKDYTLRATLGALKSKLYTMECNPTAENMARHLFEKFGPLLKKSTKPNDHRLHPFLCKVTVKETPTSSASYE